MDLKKIVNLGEKLIPQTLKINNISRGQNAVNSQIYFELNQRRKNLH